MALETAPFLSGLNPNNPAPNDPKARGDDHTRLIKQALADSFVGFPGVVLAGGTDQGVSNTYVLTPATNLRQYSQNMVVFWLPATTNGGASTMNISGLGPVPIKRIDGTSLENGDIIAGQPAVMMFSGTDFRMTSVTAQYVASLVFNGVLPGQTNQGGKFLGSDGTNAGWTNTFGVAVDEAKGANIPASSTISLTSAPGTGNFTHITGSATVNAMTLPAGASRDLCFDGVDTLVNSGSLILPTGANIVTAPGDTCVVRGEGSGVVRVTDYTRKSGRALVENTTPGLYLLATVTTTTVAVIDFLNVFSGNYDDYLVQIDGIRAPAGIFSWRVSLQVAQAGVVDASSSIMFADASSAGVQGSAIQIIPTVSNSSRASATLQFTSVNSVDTHGIQSRSISATLGGSCEVTEKMGLHFGAPAVSGFRLSMLGSGSPTFSLGGTIRVYGYKKA